tara:strand:+ start:5318 stop:5905 length:588 start_codon:yes stop_codon:yes gene_type:complete
MARKDFDIITDWINPNSRILDLGCGDGSLLKLLNVKRNVSGYGVDSSIDKTIKSLDNSINILNADINDHMGYFKDKSFDFVILAQSLQVVENPVLLIKEMLRIGNEVIISFPNMGYWKSRLYLFFKGEMPVTRELPYNWHSTPNIHLCTISDFKKMCLINYFEIINEVVYNINGKDISSSYFNNLNGVSAIFRIK